MSARDNGGPAFPQLDAYVDANGQKPVYVSEGGMSLRDWFAGMAMQGIISSPGDLDRYYEEDVVATNAYKMADAMIAERAK